MRQCGSDWSTTSRTETQKNKISRLSFRGPSQDEFSYGFSSQYWIAAHTQSLTCVFCSDNSNIVKAPWCCCAEADSGSANPVMAADPHHDKLPLPARYRHASSVPRRCSRQRQQSSSAKCASRVFRSKYLTSSRCSYERYAVHAHSGNENPAHGRCQQAMRAASTILFHISTPQLFRPHITTES